MIELSYSSLLQSFVHEQGANEQEAKKGIMRLSSVHHMDKHCGYNASSYRLKVHVSNCAVNLNVLYG